MNRFLGLSAVALVAGFASVSLAAETDMSSIDTNGDGQVQFAEMTAAFPTMTRPVFNVLDANKNGAVGPIELGRPATHKVLESFGERPFRINVSADINNNGKITFDEMQTIYPGFPRAAYDEIDMNGNGKVDLIEFNVPKSRELINQYVDRAVFLRMADVDTDGDGKLSDAELAAVIPNYQPGSFKYTGAVGPTGRRVYLPVGVVMMQ